VSAWIEPEGLFENPIDLVETCLNGAAGAVLIDASQLPADFFDLSSGVAGEWLQKMATYRVPLAIVSDPARLSTRFADLIAEERGRDRFGVFPDLETAREFCRRITARS
jgi:hypothetical protein